MILLIDNYDSFVHNLARYFARLGQETMVVRNDAINPAAVRKLNPQAIVISPGPCTPKEAGASELIVQRFCESVPLLGVCLGHQAIATALGGKLCRATEPMHGRTSEITHAGDGLFHAVPDPLRVCRYHSLIVDERHLPSELEITARAADGTPMALAHRQRPVFGVQFHPEAILSEHGYTLLANFLKAASLPTPDPLPGLDGERHAAPPSPALAPSVTYTF
jgi:anthranilate synthase component II